MAAASEVEKLKAKVAATKFRCLTKPEIDSYSFVWTLKDFRGISLPVESTLFPQDARSMLRWRMYLKPNIGSGKAMQVGVKLVSLPPSPNFEFRVSLVSTNSVQRESWEMVKDGEAEPVELDLVAWQDLWGKHADLICHGALTMLCEIRVVGKVVTMAVEKSSERILYDSELANQLEQLFIDGHISDARLKFGNSHISVNMGILSARSPVFRSLFADVVNEGAVLPIEIDFDNKGVEREVLAEMVRFMYTGKHPLRLKKLALDLMRAADKFKVETLKGVCEDHFRAQLDVDNAIDTYMAARECSADWLKAFTVEFIRFHLKEVSKTDRWKEAVEEKKIASLALDVLQICVQDESWENSPSDLGSEARVD